MSEPATTLLLMALSAAAVYLAIHVICWVLVAIFMAANHGPLWLRIILWPLKFLIGAFMLWGVLEGRRRRRRRRQDD